MEIAIIGTGAIGGYYGSRLAHNGNDVHFLVRSDYDHIKDNGLVIDSHFGDFSLAHPNIYKDVCDMPACDLVCVATKATANSSVFPLVKNVLKEDGTILLMQNGFGFEQQLTEIYPGHAILGGMCFICSYKDSPGVIHHTNYGKLSLSTLYKEDLSVLSQIADIFTSAGVETEVINDLLEARMKKLMWNIPYNGMSVISDCTTEVLATDPSMRQATYAVMEEIIEAAKACGILIEPAFADEMLKLTEAMTPYSPSMRLDYLSGRPMEIDAIYGKIIEYAKAHGYEMRYTRMMKWQLEYLQEWRSI